MQIFQRNKKLFIERVIPQSDFEKFEDEKIVAEFFVSSHFHEIAPKKNFGAIN